MTLNNLLQSFTNYINYFKPIESDDSLIGDISLSPIDTPGQPDQPGKPIVSDTNLAEVNLIRKLRQLFELDDDTLTQIGLYYYLQYSMMSDKIDERNTARLKTFESEGVIMANLVQSYLIKNYEKSYDFLEASTWKCREMINNFLEQRVNVFLNLQQKIICLKNDKKSTKKARFGLNCFVLLLALIMIAQPTYGEQCCSYGDFICPDNSFYSKVSTIYVYNGSLCNNYETMSMISQQETNMIITRCFSSSIDAYNCLTMSGLRLNGNDLFCNTTECSRSRYDCYCNSTYSVMITNCLDNNGDYLGVADKIDQTCYYYNEQQNYNSFDYRRKRTLISCPVINILSDKDNIYASVPADWNNCALYIQKDTWMYQMNFAQSNLIVEIPSQAKMKTGKFDIQVNCNGVLCHHSSATMSYDKDCQIFDCIFCWEVYSSYNCLPDTYKVFIFISSVLIVLIVLMIIPGVWCIIRVMYQCFCIPNKLAMKFGKRKLKNIKKNFKSYSKSVGDYLEEDDFDEDDKETQNDKKRIAQTRLNKRKLNVSESSIVLVCMIFFISVSVSQTCVDSPSIAINQPNCISVSPTTETCSLQFTTTVTIPSPGLSSCLSFYDQNNKLLTSMTITYVNRTDTALLNTLYYTSRWTPKYSSFFGCYDDGWCDGSCSSQTSRTMYGFDSNIATYPGQTVCRSGCGCAACGCFYCVGGCVVYGYSLQPTDSVMSVSSVNSVSYVYYFNVSINGETFIFGQNSQSVVKNGFTFNFLGSLSQSTSINLASSNIVYNSTSSYWCPTSIKNSPIQQTIGDIQSSSLSRIMSLSTDAFIYDPNIVSTIDQDKSESFVFRQNGLNTLSTCPSFPTTIGNQVWGFNGYNLISSAINPGTSLFTVSTSQDLQITRTKTTLCPVCNFVSASGCFDCLIGSTVVLQCKATCTSGLAGVASNDNSLSINTQSILLTLSYQEFNIDIIPSSSIVDSSLIIGNQNDQISVTFSFLAIQNISLRNDSSQLLNNASSGSQSSINFNIPSWNDFLSSLSNPLSSYYGSSIIILTISIIVILILICLSMFCLSKMCSTNNSKYKSI
jgi:hypothetical protein